MHEKLYPQLIEVDPMRIKFNERNPRKHQGSEFLRLKESVKEIGVVQLPTVRVLSGGFYECIDGEGRVKAAQEAQLPMIWVVSLGKISDVDALIMLQAANVVRDFSYLAGCKGLANLHRQGKTGESIARSLGVNHTTIQADVAVGYFPEQLLVLIQEDLLRFSQEGIAKDGTPSQEGLGGKRTLSWSARTFHTLLPLRVQIVGRGDASAQDGLYDYTEVQRAIEKIIHGEILTHERLQLYVEQRRRELFEERFDKALQIQLETELTQAKQALEEVNAQRLENVREETVLRYEAQVVQLQQQLSDLKKRSQEMVKEVATKLPESIAKREVELQQKLQEIGEERLLLQSIKQEIEKEARTNRQQMEQDLKNQAEAALKEQRLALERELAQARIDLEAYYAQKDQDRQFRAEKTVRQAIAHGTELLCQSQQWLLLLISPAMVRSLAWLKEPDVVSLLAQIKTVRGTLEQAEEMVLHGNVSNSVPSDTEGEAPYAYNTHQSKPSTNVGYR